MMMKKVLYFDLGGVIFTDLFSGGEVKMAKFLGLTCEELLSVYRKTDVADYPKGKINDEQRWKLFTNELGLPDPFITSCIQEYYKSYLPIKDTIDFIHKLSQDGRYSLGVLSDQPSGVTNYLRSSFKKVFELFEPNLILISAEIGLSKKDADFAIYKSAIEKSNVDIEDILFIDNSKNNIDNAATLGIDSFFFDIINISPENLIIDLKKCLNSENS